MARPLGIRREAKAEITEAHDWYEERRRGLGAEFLAEVKKAVASHVVPWLVSRIGPQR